jgi:hypothetical protein
MRRTDNQFVDSDGEMFLSANSCNTGVYRAFWNGFHPWETIFNHIERL